MLPARGFTLVFTIAAKRTVSELVEWDRQTDRIHSMQASVSGAEIGAMGAELLGSQSCMTLAAKAEDIDR